MKETNKETKYIPSLGRRILVPSENVPANERDKKFVEQMLSDDHVPERITIDLDTFEDTTPSNDIDLDHLDPAILAMVKNRNNPAFLATLTESQAIALKDFLEDYDYQIANSKEEIQ